MERISKKLMKKSVTINEETMKSFLEYEWPGNVRELENIIELMVNTESIPDGFMKTDGNGAENTEGYSIRRDQAASSEAAVNECLDLEFMEKNHILKVLDLYGGNISLCAKTLGIGRNTLYRKIESYGIKCSVTERRSMM
jgi:transcriptional regulator with PAS, ATPase and Fis domain